VREYIRHGVESEHYMQRLEAGASVDRKDDCSGQARAR
jgi:hypothetical protein